MVCMTEADSKSFAVINSGRRQRVSVRSRRVSLVVSKVEDEIFIIIPPSERIRAHTHQDLNLEIFRSDLAYCALIRTILAL